METGISSPKRAMGWLCAVASILAMGCFGPDEEERRFDVGEEGRLSYWVREGCPFGDECAPLQTPLHIDASLPQVFVGHTGELLEEPVPDLQFSSEKPDVFTVRDLECNPVFDQGSLVTEPCDAVDRIYAYVVNLELHAAGESDLIARTMDGELYDRSPIPVYGTAD